MIPPNEENINRGLYAIAVAIKKVSSIEEIKYILEEYISNLNCTGGFLYLESSSKSNSLPQIISVNISIEEVRLFLKKENIYVQADDSFPSMVKLNNEDYVGITLLNSVGLLALVSNKPSFLTEVLPRLGEVNGKYTNVIKDYLLNSSTAEYLPEEIIQKNYNPDEIFNAI